MFKQLVEQGHALDVIDFWDGDEDDDFENLTVSLQEVPREIFRFIEGFAFDLVP